MQQDGIQSQAVAKFQRIAPRKARLVLDLIRGKSVPEARTILQFSDRAAAETILKVVNSAASNAENNHQANAEDLTIVACFADEGPTLKRIRPRARGMAYRIRKRTSHITVVVGTKE
ncbi:MAG: 50S ribosomal protein L22 [Coriobacteriia bacterium]|nr:50S ribosomal protein L22 [Coriobacteriia bacterium]